MGCAGCCLMQLQNPEPGGAQACTTLKVSTAGVLRPRQPLAQLEGSSIKGFRAAEQRREQLSSMMHCCSESRLSVSCQQPSCSHRAYCHCALGTALHGTLVFIILLLGYPDCSDMDDRDSLGPCTPRILQHLHVVQPVLKALYVLTSWAYLRCTHRRGSTSDGLTPTLFMLRLLLSF